MTITLLDTLVGSGNLEAHTPDIGGATWSKTSGPSMALAGTLATSEDPSAASLYSHPALNATPAGSVSYDCLFSDSSGTPILAVDLRRKASTERYDAIMFGNGNVVVRYVNADASVVEELFTGNAGTALWRRLTLTCDAAFNFTLKAESAAARADLGTGTAFVGINNAPFSDPNGRLSSSGRTGFYAREAVLARVEMSDAVQPGPVLSAPTVSAVGSGTATIAVTTDLAAGDTLYYKLQPAADPAPADASALAGAATFTETITGAGAKSHVFTGLVNGTALKCYLVQYGPSGTSNIVGTPSFTPLTGAPPGPGYVATAGPYEIGGNVVTTGSLHYQLFTGSGPGALVSVKAGGVAPVNGQGLFQVSHTQGIDVWVAYSDTPIGVIDVTRRWMLQPVTLTTG